MTAPLRAILCFHNLKIGIALFETTNKSVQSIGLLQALVADRGVTLDARGSAGCESQAVTFVEGCGIVVRLCW